MKRRLLFTARLSFPFASAIAAGLLAAPSASAQNGNWNVDAAGNWGTASNWNPAAVPGTTAGDVIGFTNNISAARTVTISAGSVTMGTLNIGDSNSTHGFTLARSGSHLLILDNGGSNAQINKTTTIADIISAPVQLNSHLAANATGQITLSGGITETGGSRNLIKSGTGALVINGVSNYTGTTEATAGTLRFVTPGSLYNNTEANWTAANLNVKSGATLAFNVSGAAQFTDANITTLLTNLAVSGSATEGMNAGSNYGFNTDTAPNFFTLTGLIADSTGANGGVRGLQKLGIGTLVLTNANPYTGATTINGGTLRLENTSASSSITLLSGTILQVGIDSAFSGSRIVSTAGTIVSDRATAGAGLTHVFSGVSRLGTGNTNITAGANVTSGTAAIQFASLDNDSGTVAGFGLNPTTANVLVTGDVNLGGGANAGTANFTLGGTGSVNSIGGAIINGSRATGNLIKSGTSTWTLSGDSTYTGTTTISAGTLDLGGGTATGSLASPTLTLAGGTFAYTRTGTNTQSFTNTNLNAGPAGSISVAAGNTLNLGTITRGAGGWIDFSTTGAGIVAAPVAGNVDGIMPGLSFGNTWAVANGDGVAISGLGSDSYTLTSVAATGAANYANRFIEVNNSAGILDGAITPISLRFNTAGANTVTLTGTPNIITSGGILVSNAVGANLSTITGGELAGAAGADLAVIQNNPLGGLTISSVIANNGGATALSKFGAGLLTLTGANTYTGVTAVSGGTLRLSGAGTLGAPGSPVSVSSGALLDLNGTNHSIAFAAGAGPGTVANNSGGGTSILTLSGTPTINGGLVTIVDHTTTPGGKVGVVITGNTQPMSNLNTYSGGTTVNGGAFLYLNATSPMGAGTGAITLTAPGTGATGNTGSGLVVDSVTYANDITGAGYIHANSGTANNVTFTGNLTNSGPYIWRGAAVANNTFNFVGNGTTSVLSGVIGSTTSQVNGAVATGNVIKSGTGTLTLSGANIYTGTTTINGGNLILSGAGVIRNNATNTITINPTGTLTMSRTDTWGNSASGVPVIPVVINAGGTLTTGGNFFNTLGALTLNGGTLTSTGGANANFGSWALRGTVTAGGSSASTIAQSGTNANINLGANSVTGTTFNVSDVTGNADVDLTVSAVLQNGKNAANLAQVSSLTKTGTGTMTLTGTNTYTGDTTVTAGTLELADNAQLRLVLGAASGTNNRLTGAGIVSLDGDLNLDTAAADALDSGSWTLVDNATLAATYTANFTVFGFTDAGGNQWTKPNGPAKRYTFDETTGVLTLGPSSSAVSYASWIAGFGLVGPDALVTADPDKDGIANAVEMVLGGNPATGMDTALLPTLELVTNPTGPGPIPPGEYLLFTYRRSAESALALITARGETDTDLIAPWTPAINGAAGVVIQEDLNYLLFSPAAPANTDRVRVYVPRVTAPKIFGRLNVVVP